ncbi:acyltransferase family protein [Streptomyces syringium]|uniref:3-O-acyltransferase n=1 Tax=Streptomyces syringium TaxID=76729 RepID=A0ABS4XY26_9ACTN|nr:acyltransferase [Streptomyces syringium]MBP2401426.1 3-O-acyltransferase [Streptomyces syringium]
MPAASPGPAAPDSSSPPRDLPSLTGYRFVLALVVLVCHAAFISSVYQDQRLHDLLGLTLPLATGAVASFFLLSGFILTWSAPRHEPRRRFWRRRFWKIVPNHVAAWLVAVVFLVTTAGTTGMLATPTDAEPAPALANLLLIQNWVPLEHYYVGPNVPAWSISCEAFFYLLFPFLLTAVRRIAAPRLWRWWGAVAAAIPLMALVSLLVNGPTLYDWLPLNGTQLWFVYAFPPVRVLEFTLGILTARLVQEGRWIEVRRPVLIGLPVAAFALVPVLPATFVFGAALCVPLALVIPALAGKDIAARASVLRHPRLVALGQSSYALYIIHYPIIMIVRHVLGAERKFGVAAGTLLVLGIVALSLLASHLLYRYCEVPLMRRYARPRPAPHADPATAGDPYAPTR